MVYNSTFPRKSINNIMRQVKLEAIFKEHEQKLKKFKLKSDPVDSSKTYVGYMLSEDPIKPQITLEFVGSALKSIGGGIRKAEQYAKSFRQFAEGDLTKLEDLGNYLLDRMYDKMTGNLLKFGKKGYTRVNLNDDTIVTTLNEFAATKVKKESFLTRVNEGIFSFLSSKPKTQPQPASSPTPQKPQQLELPLKIKQKAPKPPKVTKEMLRNRERMREIARNLTLRQKLEMIAWLELQMELRKKENQSSDVNERTDVSDLKNLITKDTNYTPELLSDLQQDVEPEKEDTGGVFTENNLVFNIVNQKKFGRGTQFLLKPESQELAKSLKDIGVYQVTIFRLEDKEGSSNSLDVYFYSDATNVIPQLMFSGLKYAFDGTKKAYVVNSKIAAKKLPVVFKASLPVAVNSVDIISRDDANKVIRFNFKPNAFTAQSGLANYKDRFSQPTTKKATPGEIYASVTAPFQYSEGKDFYILDLSRMGINFDRNYKFYTNEQLKNLKAQPATKSKQPPKATTAAKQPVTTPAPKSTKTATTGKQTKLKL
jgi:hypothetical protein